MPACPTRAAGFQGMRAGTGQTGRAMRASAQAKMGCRLGLAPFPLARDLVRFPEAISRRIPPGQAGRPGEFLSRYGRRLFRVALLRPAESGLKAVPCRD